MANVADYNVANASGASVRSDINNILQAVVTLNSGTSEPSTMYPFMIWVDTTNNLVKMRNGANDGWLTMPFAMNASDTAPNGLTVSGGDLTVDTSTLKVDSTNNRVGVGTASPATDLQIAASDTTSEIQFSHSGSGTGAGNGMWISANGNDFDIRNKEAGNTSLWTNNTERVTINSSGSLGIGTSSPSSLLDIEADPPVLTLTNSRNGSWTSGDLVGHIKFFSNDSSGIGTHEVGFIKSVADTGSTTLGAALTFGVAAYNTAASEAIRIDEDGNLLVGTTESNPSSSSVNTAGQSFSTTGGVRSTVGSNPAATFNRKGDDGDVILFRKNGVTVGSIGTNDPAVYIGSGDVGVRFDGVNDRIRPVGNSSNLEAVRDNAIDLGDSAARFKDLYLSGGAYIGGTAAANKLDDYEEGSWTPNWSIGNGSTTGTYVKVGNIVTVTATFTMGSTTTMGTKLEATNLPFSCANMTYSGARYENNAQNSYLGATRATGSQLRAYTVRTDTTEATEQTVSTNEPFTWGEDDYAQLSITYATS